MTRPTDDRNEVAVPVEADGAVENEALAEDDDDGEPKFGRLLICLILAVIFCAVLTWVMGRYFPDFPNFS